MLRFLSASRSAVTSDAADGETAGATGGGLLGLGLQPEKANSTAKFSKTIAGFNKSKVGVDFFDLAAADMIRIPTGRKSRQRINLSDILPNSLSKKRVARRAARLGKIRVQSNFGWACSDESLGNY